VEYVRLVAKLFEVAPTIRNYFINEDFLNFIKNALGKFDGEEMAGSLHEYIHSTLHLMKQVLKVHELDRDTTSHPKKSTIYELLPVLSNEIKKCHSSSCMGLVLSSVKEICMIKKDEVIHELFERHIDLLKWAIELLTYDSGEIMYASARLLTNFSISSNPMHIAFLFENAILDRIFQAYHQAGNRDGIQHMLLSLLSNLTADDLELQERVITHPIMTQVIVREALDSFNPVNI
jgi:hypothetical protein